MEVAQTSHGQARTHAVAGHEQAMRESWQERTQPLLLVVDAEAGDHDCLVRACAAAGVALYTCRDGAEALLQAGRLSPDVVIVNALVELVTAADVIATLHAHLPARIAVALGDGQTEALAPALLAGAAEVVNRPYQERQITALLRSSTSGPSTGGQREDVIIAGPLTLDSAAFDVALSGKRLKLSFREFELLRHLMLNANRVVSRDEIRHDVWRVDAADMTNNTIVVHIGRLRTALQGVVEIRTVRNRGYQLLIDEATP